MNLPSILYIYMIHPLLLAPHTGAGSFPLSRTTHHSPHDMTRPVFLLPFFFILIVLLAQSHLSFSNSHFEGFEDDESDAVPDPQPSSFNLPHLLLSQSSSSPPPDETPNPDPPSPSTSDPSKPTSALEYWDEDEFEGIPNPPIDRSKTTNPATDNKDSDNTATDPEDAADSTPMKKQSFAVEIVAVSFLIIFAINYFTGKRENENLALAWAAKFATKDSIFDKNFSLLGVGKNGEEDAPLLLKENQNVFKFYASGRRYCQGMLATMELKSRHDLISRLYNMVVPCKDEITFEVYMNDEAMDLVIFALARKKVAKGMQKELRDLNRFAVVMGQGLTGRKWVADELAVVTESKEVAGDLITETVLEQVFGDKAIEKYGKGFISLHFSDQHPGAHKKMLLFKFALPDINNMADMTRLVALVPYYIDLIGRYKLSSQARSKPEAARSKAAQEAYKELQNARQEALQRKKAERRKLLEEAEAKLGAEAIRKKEAKERARQMKKAAPKVKMTRAH